MAIGRTHTPSYPEGIFVDNELHERARHALMAVNTGDEVLALDVLASAGPGWHRLARSTRGGT